MKLEGCLEILHICYAFVYKKMKLIALYLVEETV